MIKAIKYTKTAMLIGAVCFFSSACSKSLQVGATKTVIARQTVNELERDRVPGTHTEPWVETMHDVVKVPGAIDKKGMYYRLPHKTIYEIRPGKYQKVQYPDSQGRYISPKQ